MPDTLDISTRYLIAQRSFVELARTLSDDDWSTQVPCTPEWTVRDVLSHVSGIPDDAVAGRMEGAPGEAWTAAQIERNRSQTVDELLSRWEQQSAGFASIIQQIDESRPPFDCHTHEHDVRQALGRPGNRDSVLVDRGAIELAAIAACPVPLTVEFADGRVVRTGSGETSSSVTLSDVTPFEIFRSRPGRRSREQVRSWNWTGTDTDIDAVLARWFVFGPSATPIAE